MSVTYYSNPNATSQGLVYIFNYTRYFKHSTATARVGSIIDRDLIKDLFGTLGFNPKDIHVREDLPERDLFESLNGIMTFNRFSEYRSLWIFILTHGCENDFLYAADALFHINKVKLALSSTTHWIGIPKLVVVQACRGGETDEGVPITGDFCDMMCHTDTDRDRDTDSDANSEAIDYNVPTTSDTIFFHSTWQGFASFRAPDGTPFIRFFVANMQRHFYSDDIVKIFTKVCRDVAYNFSACTPGTSKFTQLKQMPCFEHSFMSKLHFGLDLQYSQMTSETIQLEQYKIENQYRGLVIFFYQKDYSFQNMCDRSADGDVERLYHLLNDFRYKVQIRYDKTATEIRAILRKTSNHDFSEYDSLVIIFSGHGIADKLFLRKGFIYTNEIWDSFTNVGTLVGKPKLFFISACRGGLHDKGSIGELVPPVDKPECVNQSDVEVKYETSSEEPHKIPIKADILAVFASAADYVSIVDPNERGTFFLIELYNVLSQVEKEESIMDILYRLNENLAKRTTKDLLAEKQMSFVLSSLTKELYFSKGNVLLNFKFPGSFVWFWVSFLVFSTILCFAMWSIYIVDKLGPQ